MTLYPLLMAPYFRSGEETPWGGDMLRDAFMKDALSRPAKVLKFPHFPAVKAWCATAPTPVKPSPA